VDWVAEGLRRFYRIGNGEERGTGRNANKMGADVVINPASEDAVKRILGETGGTGVDALLEMSGNPMAIQQGFKALRAGGRASLLGIPTRSEEHTSELQSRGHLVCRLLLEKKKILPLHLVTSQ